MNHVLPSMVASADPSFNSTKHQLFTLKHEFHNTGLERMQARIHKISKLIPIRSLVKSCLFLR